ncbi:MAG: GTP-binding protein [Actinotalea sp.]|nr:GTP-binding protein [Actinotalea sp.]
MAAAVADLSVTERLDALARSVGAGQGVLTDDVVERARTIEAKAGHRLRLSSDHTVVAFAGSTGSGKSSLFNAIAGAPVAEVDVLRPTTSEALALIRGLEGAGQLLDWLDVRRRHQLAPGAGPGLVPVGGASPDGTSTDGDAADGTRADGTRAEGTRAEGTRADETRSAGTRAAGAAADGRPSGGRGEPGAEEDGLILLDLPDHDSVRTEHRLEAERLVALVDLMVWVVDPQKYADAAVHERYLRGLGAHIDVVLIVLNQVDRLTPAERDACHRDLERLLAEDGLAGVRVLDVSARTGEGVDALAAALDDAARRRVASVARVEADVIGTAQTIQEQCGSPSTAAAAPRTELVTSLAAAAGVPLVVEAVRSARLLHAHRATGWPVTRWLSRFRADPLRKLHLGAGAGTAQGTDARDRRTLDGSDSRTDLIRTSVPPPGPAELARARSAVRSYTDAATAGVPDAWVLEARAGTLHAQGPDAARLSDALNRAVGGTRVVSDRRPVWWAAVGALQWLLCAVMVAGLLWLGALAGLDALRIPVPEPPRWGEVPIPTLAAVGGAVLGLLVAGVSRIVAGVGARRQARRATAELHAAVTEVADRLVVEPVDAVLRRLRECRAAADEAAAPSQRRRRGPRELTRDLRDAVRPREHRESDR